MARDPEWVEVVKVASILISTTSFGHLTMRTVSLTR